MQQIYFTKQQKNIIDIQKLYPDKGICNIAGIIHVKNVKNYMSAVFAMQKNLEDIDIFHLQVDKNDMPYISDRKVEFFAWEGDAEPTDEELTIWLNKNLYKADEPLYEARYFVKKDEVKLYIKLHHIVMDGYSVAYTVGRFNDYYIIETTDSIIGNCN